MYNKLIGIFDENSRGIICSTKGSVKNKIAWNIKVFFARYYSYNQNKNTEVGGELARVGSGKV